MKALKFIIFVSIVMAVWFFLTGVIFILVSHAQTPIEFSTAYQYWYHYRGDPVIAKHLSTSAFLSLLLVFFPVIMWLKPKPRSLHGDAKFAGVAEIKAAELMSEEGILVGLRNGKFLKFGGSRHVLMAAPTRSGKGVGIVVPNLLNWKDSVVVLDTKRENWELTAGFRAKHGQRVFLFDPVSEDYATHRWNPLGYISSDINLRINDVQKIASMLWTATEGESGHWDALSRSLFLGVVLYLMDTEELTVTMGEALRQVMSGDPAKHFKKILKDRTRVDDAEISQPLASQTIESFSAFIGYADRTRSSIISSYASKLELWMNPLVDAATQENDFDLRDLRRQRMSVYVGVSPNNLTRLQPILNLFFQQTIDLNTSVLPEHDPSLKYQCLMLMDEFAAIGRIEILAKSIAFVAGFGLRLLPIVQSPSQLIDIYGEHLARNFMVNHACKVIFAPSDQKDAQEISDLLGQTTVKATSKGRSVSQGYRTRSTNVSDQRRALMLPQELREMGDREAIILVENTAPVKAKKIRYYEDKEMLSRIISPPTIKKLNVKPVIVPGHIIDSIKEERGMNAEELKTNSGLELNNFKADFSKIEVPESDLTPDQINRLADQFMNVLGE